MLVSNSIIKNHMSQALDYYYYNFLELLHGSSDFAIRYYVNDINNPLENMNYAIEYDDELNIIVYSDEKSLLEEIILNELPRTSKKIILKCYSNLCKTDIVAFGFVDCEENTLDRFGVYGIVVADEKGKIDNSIVKITSCEKAKSFNELLDSKKWNNLSMHIKHFNNKDVLYLKYNNNNLAGYLWAINGYDNYYDIAMLWVPVENRQSGIGTSLVQNFKADMLADSRIPYYGNCASISSQRIAIKCGFQNILSAPITYVYENDKRKVTN